ncbi:Septin-8-A [Goodea atripinnis]|uniref:Septin-8-A n=1 Tax=Goodea atripinnis TaxID=208336 RepID=A0ABV0MJG5_9TELE
MGRKIFCLSKKGIDQFFFGFVHSYKPIVDYIDTQFENYLQEELKIKRSLFNYHDTRIHICLYFIAPTGHSLKSLDLVTMKKLDSKVNIIPIIAKADTISKSELHKFKIKIMSELVSNGVQIYQFPTDDEAVSEINASMNVSRILLPVRTEASLHNVDGIMCLYLDIDKNARFF